MSIFMVIIIKGFHKAYRRPKRRSDNLIHAKLNHDPNDDGPTGESKPCGTMVTKSAYLQAGDTNPDS